MAILWLLYYMLGEMKNEQFHVYYKILLALVPTNGKPRSVWVGPVVSPTRTNDVGFGWNPLYFICPHWLVVGAPPSKHGSWNLSAFRAACSLGGTQDRCVHESVPPPLF